LVLDLQLGHYWEVEAVLEEKTVFPVDSQSSNVPIVHTVGKALSVGVDKGKIVPNALGFHIRSRPLGGCLLGPLGQYEAFDFGE
jgi:hypothetical protein